MATKTAVAIVARLVLRRSKSGLQLFAARHPSAAVFPTVQIGGSPREHEQLGFPTLPTTSQRAPPRPQACGNSSAFTKRRCFHARTHHFRAAGMTRDAVACLTSQVCTDVDVRLASAIPPAVKRPHPSHPRCRAISPLAVHPALELVKHGNPSDATRLEHSQAGLPTTGVLGPVAPRVHALALVHVVHKQALRFRTTVTHIADARPTPFRARQTPSREKQTASRRSRHRAAQGLPDEPRRPHRLRTRNALARACCRASTPPRTFRRCPCTSPCHDASPRRRPGRTRRLRRP
jgi:hypothetical protein